QRDAKVEFITPESPAAREIYRHTTSHLLAHAVKELFPEVKIGIGPATEEGFFYDFERPTPFTPEDLERIEARMREIQGSDFPIRRLEQPKAEALRYFEGLGDNLKVELVREKGGEVVSCYRQDSFMDFCTGPHVPSTGRLGAFKLLSIAGAYWRGDEKREQLQRIYATAFFGKDELATFLHRREEAEKRDHRKIGVQLDLFRILPEAPGFPLWMPHGTIVFNELVDEMRRKLRRRDYVEVRTPHIMNAELWKRSGHWS